MNSGLQDGAAGGAEIRSLPVCLPAQRYPVLTVDWSVGDAFLGQLVPSGQEADRMLTGILILGNGGSPEAGAV